MLYVLYQWKCLKESRHHYSSHTSLLYCVSRVIWGWGVGVLVGCLYLIIVLIWNSEHCFKQMKWILTHKVTGFSSHVSGSSDINCLCSCNVPLFDIYTYIPCIHYCVIKTEGCRISHKYTNIQIYSVKYYKHFMKNSIINLLYT